MAYAAIISFRYVLEGYRNTFDCFLPPSLLEILEFADKELKSIQEFVEGLDSSSRMRMNASLQQIAAATREFQHVFHLPVAPDEKPIQDLKQETHSFIEMLKKMVEECYNEGASVSESKMIGLSDVYSKVKAELVNDLSFKPILLLVGMAGIGKTTLARKFFEDLDISLLLLHIFNLNETCIKHCYKLKDVYLLRVLCMSKIEVVDCNPLMAKEMKNTALENEIPQLFNDLSVHSSWDS